MKGSSMSWQGKAQQRQYKVVLSGKDFDKVSTQSEVSNGNTAVSKTINVHSL